MFSCRSTPMFAHDMTRNNVHSLRFSHLLSLFLCSPLPWISHWNYCDARCLIFCLLSIWFLLYSFALLMLSYVRSRLPFAVLVFPVVAYCAAAVLALPVSSSFSLCDCRYSVLFVCWWCHAVLRCVLQLCARYHSLLDGLFALLFCLLQRESTRLDIVVCIATESAHCLEWLLIVCLCYWSEVLCNRRFTTEIK